MTQRNVLTVFVFLASLFGLFVCACSGLFVLPEALFYLAFGWALFLYHVLPGVQMNVGNAILAAALLAVFVVGLHAALGWLYRARQSYLVANRSADAVAPATPIWLWKWTAAIVSVTVLAFVAGISTVGVTHQFAWLATSDERLVESGMREAGWRVMSKNNLANIGKALHNYASGLGSFPPGAMTTPEGRVLHGWQTYLLPYAEASAIKQRINLNKPWNDPANREGFSTRLSLFGGDGERFGTPPADGYAPSVYSANSRLLGGTRPVKPADITDGAANTIMAGEVVGQLPAWGHPTNWRDPAAGLHGKPDQFGSPWDNAVYVLMADGSVQMLSREIDPRVLRALATPAGGEPAEEAQSAFE